MGLTIEVFDGSNWIDKTSKCVNLRWSISSRELERVDFELVNDDVSVGQQVRIKRGNVIVFEGVIYERSKTHRDYVNVRATVYSNLIMYDRHVVYRLYETGTTAGAIIRDLASLESNVNVDNVDDGPSLLSNWEIENQPALEVMKSVARGVNYWLRMKPNKILYFKPKQTGTYVAIIDSSQVISAEYSEDRWKLKNRVIYVGAGGQVLADVSEGAGDLPVVVHDPFLTDPNEALRRANIRLALNKEYGRQLRIEMHQDDFEAMNLDLGDTVRVNLSSLGLENVDMYLIEIEYDPRSLRYVLILGGRLELFEEFFEEAVGGDVASRFGQSVNVPELISTIYTTIDATNIALKLQADARTLRLYNKPPLILENAQNVILDEDGYAKLVSGATQGSFECSYLPESGLFSRWLRVIYDCDPGGGSVRADLLRADDTTLEYNVPDIYDIPYLPQTAGWWTEQNSNEWGAENGSLSDSRNAVISYWSIKAVKSGSTMKIYYPKAKNAGWNLSKYKYMIIYFYSENDDPDLKIRLKKDDSNYFEAIVNHRGGVWRRYEILLSSFGKIGDPALDNINWIEIETDLPSINIDSDYMFAPVLRELLKLKFTLSRPSPDAVSPKVKLVKFVWREGK